MHVTSLVPEYRENVPVEKICSPVFIRQNRLLAFSEVSIAFLDEISRQLFKRADLRKYPEIMALAYWLRKGNVLPMVSDFQGSLQVNQVIVPRGLSFHVAPSNVDSIFCYSWAMSMLAGNSNIVRVSQSHSEQVMRLLEVIRACMEPEDYREIRSRNKIITYQHDELISSFLSEQADVRILWGGDETIAKIRSLSAKPTAKDISFADKVSYCAINADVFVQLGPDKLGELSRRFYNDAYWFDQMACSSPRLVYFIGEPGNCEKASAHFWEAVSKDLEERSHSDTMAVAMNKLVFLYECVLDGLSLRLRSNFQHDKPAVVRVEPNGLHIPEAHCGGGFFLECFLRSLSELAPFVQPKDQTLTYFGFQMDELRDLVLSLSGKGLDRVVPMGAAMNFAPVWDGYVLLTELTKRVCLGA
jgi:hypothetical protein